MAARAAFVGREGELSRLLVALGGDVRLVLVVGDAGIGKTRFAGEGMARAAAAGMVLVRGECLPLAEALPLLPVAAALGELARVDGGGLVAAALDAAPGYVGAEIGRLVPGLGTGGGPGLGTGDGPGLAGGRDEGWQRQRLFAAVAELLDAVAGRAGCRVGLVVEDVHWADGATLDLLTFLTRLGSWGAVSVLATSRSDEAPVAGHVADWLAQMRGAAGVEEIRLGPLAREEVAQQVAALAGVPVPLRVVDELYARTEGNPFFTEQLVAAGLGDGAGGGLGVPAGLPGRLGELLAARAARCSSDARAVLAGLAVAGRPLSEEQLGAVAGLGAETTRGGLRELATAQLLGEDTAGGTHRPRHRLLAEAVAAGLLPGERAALHEGTARALAAAGDQTLAAEIAGHWQAAGKPGQELPAQVAAAEAAERVFGYAEAAVHWQRAIELARTDAGAGSAAGHDVAGLYLRAMSALDWSGDSVRAGEVAEEAYRRFAGHPDPATAAVVRYRVACFRRVDVPAAGLTLIEEALRLYEQAGPSAGHAEALLDYAVFLLYAYGRTEDALPALDQALGIAEAAGATAMIPRVLAILAAEAFRRGQIEQGFAFLDRAWATVGDDGVTLAWLAINEYIAMFCLARFQEAGEIALRGLDRARQAGLGASWWAAILAAAAADALLTRGRTAEAAALIDPLTARPPGRDDWVVHQARAELDMLRGDIPAAAARHQLTDAIPGRLAYIGSVEFVREAARQAAELALWGGRPGDALAEIQRVLGLFKTPVLTMFCGPLLVTGMRACADLAEQARARRDEAAAAQARAAAADLASWADRSSGAPLTDHPLMATTPATRATWDAERARVAGASDAEAWRPAAEAWQDLGCPHLAAYARWRQAETHMDGGQQAAASVALRAAAAAADGHVPLLAQIRQLAERARISLQPPAADVTQTPPRAAPPAPYGLTERELAVLRLLAAGCTNAQIGTELYISPKTAGVHVSNILRKLGVSGRVQAAALAERAGLLAAPRV
jgi:DNA-binding NarL/FixJ family response regulator/tetratricopeptide (TPR) repeat protein